MIILKFKSCPAGLLGIQGQISLKSKSFSDFVATSTTMTTRQLELQLHYITLDYTNSITLHSTTVHDSELHHTTTKNAIAATSKTTTTATIHICTIQH